nr:photosynthetic complex putative assembly protein PuhB [Halorhodospira halochloris]
MCLLWRWYSLRCPWPYGAVLAVKEHDFEPIPGLPERPPEGEQILWQGKPAWWSFTKRALHVRKVAAYFLIVGTWFAYTSLRDGDGVNYALGDFFGQIIIGALVCGGLIWIGRWMVKHALYTITSQRIVMRIGASWQASINLPFAQVESVDLRKHRDGHSDITVKMDQRERLSFMFFWPHIRPWRLNRPEPMLRSLPDGDEAVKILVDALKKHVESEQKEERRGNVRENQGTTNSPAYANEAR